MDKEPLITVNLESLTPIWTGNAFPEIKDIKASSILGSIRWWYEILCRSLGKKVCNNTCKLERDDFLKDLLKNKTIENALEDQKICPACKLFGCNGWAGKIKLIVDDRGKKCIDRVQVGTRSGTNKKRSLDGKMFEKENGLKLLIYSVKKLTAEEIELLNLTIRIISDYAALGGRTSQGNGVVKIIPENPNRKYNIKVERENPKNSGKEDWKIPVLDNFFFLKIHLKFEEDISSIIGENHFWTSNNSSSSNQWKRNWTEYGFIPIGFHIRDTIRRVVEDEESRHELFGRYEGSKIFVSHGYKIDESTVEVRIWGYYENSKIEKLVSEIENKLTDGKSLKDNLFINDYSKNLHADIYSSLYGKELFKKYLQEV